MSASISFDLLSTFITFVESDNIVDAAKKLHVSQPAVTLQLKKLESNLPYPLFSFEGKRKVLSHYGHSLYHSIKGKLSEVEIRLNQVNLLYSNSENISLKIGARKEIFYRIIDQINFTGKLELIDLTNAECLTRLLKHEIDIAITHVRPDLANVISRKVFSDFTKLLVHKQLLKWKKLTLNLIKNRDFLTGTPCIIYKKENPPFISKWIAHVGVDLDSMKVKAICEDWQTILAMIEKGIGFSMIPSSFEPGSKDILSIDIPRNIIPENVFYMLYHTDLRRIKAIKEFIAKPA